jgi:hypothetical protein
MVSGMDEESSTGEGRKSRSMLGRESRFPPLLNSNGGDRRPSSRRHAFRTGMVGGIEEVHSQEDTVALLNSGRESNISLVSFSVFLDGGDDNDDDDNDEDSGSSMMWMMELFRRGCGMGSVEGSAGFPDEPRRRPWAVKSFSSEFSCRFV